MRPSLEAELKRLVEGREGPDGVKAIVTTLRWVRNNEWLQQAIGILRRADLPSDGTAQGRSARQQVEDRQTLRDLESQVESERSTHSVPAVGTVLTENPVVAEQVNAIRWRVSLDWAVASIAQLRTSDHILRGEAEISVARVPSLATSTFEAFATRVADNAKFIQQAIDKGTLSL